MDENIDDYLGSLAAACGGVESIWLIGSRANGTARTNSDWDLIAFGNSTVLACLKAHTELHRFDIDFLVVTNGDDFQNAWGDRNKSGSLSRWEWRQLSDTRAEYTESKSVESKDGGEILLRHRVSMRLWPDGAPSP